MTDTASGHSPAGYQLFGVDETDPRAGEAQHTQSDAPAWGPA